MAMGTHWNPNEETVREILTLIDSIKLELKELKELRQFNSTSKHCLVESQELQVNKYPVSITESFSWRKDEASMASTRESGQSQSKDATNLNQSQGIGANQSQEMRVNQSWNAIGANQTRNEVPPSVLGVGPVERMRDGRTNHSTTNSPNPVQDAANRSSSVFGNGTDVGKEPAGLVARQVFDEMSDSQIYPKQEFSIEMGTVSQGELNLQVPSVMMNREQENLMAIIKASGMCLLPSIETLQEANEALDFVVDDNRNKELVKDHIAFSDFKQESSPSSLQIRYEISMPKFIEFLQEPLELISDSAIDNDIASVKMDVLIAESIDSEIRLGDLKENPFEFLAISTAQQLFDKMPMRNSNDSDFSIHLNNVPLLMGNWVFDPGDFTGPGIAKQMSFEPEEILMMESALGHENQTNSNQAFRAFSCEMDCNMAVKCKGRSRSPGSTCAIFEVLHMLLAIVDHGLVFPFDPGGRCLHQRGCLVLDGGCTEGL